MFKRITSVVRLAAAERATSQVGELSRKGASGPTRPWRRPIVGGYEGEVRLKESGVVSTGREGGCK
jgi:hypothetical protein